MRDVPKSEGPLLVLKILVEVGSSLGFWFEAIQQVKQRCRLGQGTVASETTTAAALSAAATLPEAEGFDEMILDDGCVPFS